MRLVPSLRWVHDASSDKVGIWQGLSVSAIAERTGHDRNTVRKVIARGLVVPKYPPREPRPTLVGPYKTYLHERAATARPALHCSMGRRRQR